MFTEDYVMRQIEGLSRSLARIFFNKETPSEEIVSEQGEVNDILLNRRILKQLLGERKINEAENHLFSLLHPGVEKEYLDLVLWFYNCLNELDDKTLEEADFSRQEILDGMKEASSYFLNVKGEA